MNSQKIKIYLQYPWKFPDSPYYKYLIQEPPEGVEYINLRKKTEVITSKRFFWFSNFLKRNVRRMVGIFLPSMPNAHKSPNGDYNLIHCAHCLSKNKDKPWVADVEREWSFLVSGKMNEKSKKRIRQIINRENCKKIMPWTEAARREILKIFPEIKDKIEVVYPAIPQIKNLKKKKNKKLKIIFIARYFNLKGGLMALEAMERLRKEQDIEGIIVSTVPEELKQKYPNLKIYELMPHNKLFELMNSADIFLYPSIVDTFGFALLEAMSFGLPTVTIKNPLDPDPRDEIISDGKTGIIITLEKRLDVDRIGQSEEEIIQKLVKNTRELIKNRELRENISKNCLKEISEGKFSIKERNKKLSKIYREALK